MSGYRVPADAHSVLSRPCPWPGCEEWTPLDRETCIECEEPIAATVTDCPLCCGEGHVEERRHSIYEPRFELVPCRCDNGKIYPDPPPDRLLVEWMTGPPGEEGTELLHEIVIEPEAESSPWLWELRAVNGSSWVRGLSLWDGKMWIVTEDRRRVRAWSVTSTALMVAAVEQRLEEGAIGSAVSSILHDQHNKPAPVPMKVTEQDLQAALEASLKGGA